MSRLIIKAVQLIAVFSIGSIAAAENTDEVNIIGARSCGQWIESRTERGSKKVGSEAWLMGYLSGMAMVSGKDAIQRTDSSSIYAWMDSYCKSKPLSDTAEGGVHLFFDLLRK
ncbi:hypothetical protein [Hydrogenophaga defluvii]|uniref:Rap1a immunity protein domain-containing protein n=1 Tax=Hydrogenophaga defluvii TaxID=249410 RepID=A0ABW2SAR8_9BURK